jgi:ADP-heptose:LPS heptosyltransferase
VKILVIKHGALGDFILAFPALSAIRTFHPGAEITLLTTAPYAPFLAAAPWLDRIEIDTRPNFWNLPGLLKLRRQLRGFDLVYDLQTSSRSSRYFTLAGKPLWSGIAQGCALPDADPNRDNLHSRERLEGQLRAAGIPHLPQPNLSWLTGTDISRFNLPEKFTLLIPGASFHRPEKRWPEQNFAQLAQSLPMPSVIIGGAGEATLAKSIPGLNLTGQTNLFELAAIAARASLAIGNDTGPMHLATALGIPSLVLFSAASNPALTAPRTPNGGWPVILSAPALSDLPVAQVLASLP